MKQEIFALVLILLCASGCARMSVEQITDKYLVTVSTDNKNTKYKNENANDNSKIDVILKGIVTKLDSKFTTKTTNSTRSNLIINIEIIEYGIMLKIVPPPRHWVTYKVDIIDSENKKVLGSQIFEDGQPNVPAIVDEMTANIYKYCMQTMRDKQN
jgi:hypothetical protein